MAEASHVRACITFAFFTFINIEVSKSVGFKNIESLQVSNCRWIKEDDYGIDFSPLKTPTGYITYADNETVYFYNPCFDIRAPNLSWTECRDGYSLCFFKAQNPAKTKLDVNSVITSNVLGQFYKLADVRDAKFQSSGIENRLVYKTNNVFVTVNLQCNNSANDASTTLSVSRDASGKIDVNNHTLTLNSPYSCLRKLPHEKHHMSGWAVFFIILLTIAAAYFFGGMLVLKHIKGATGTEMIPNYNFWVSLPGRIKYFFLRLIGKGSQGPDSYERI